MLIDHVNKALIYPDLNGGILLVISDIFDILGKIAFTIFIVSNKCTSDFNDI